MKDAFVPRSLKNSSLVFKFVFGIYLVLAGLSQFDAKQIGEKPYRFIHAAMGSLFTQKWTMFAPRPLAFSQQIQFQCGRGESKKIWLEDLKAEHSKMASITRQKMIFYFEDYLSAINVELESLQKSGSKNAENEFVNYSMSLPVVQDLALLLSKECAGQVPVAADFVKVWIQPPNTERVKLWGI